MPASSPENYLATEVKTASPQKLQLLLIEAALRLPNAQDSSGTPTRTSRPCSRSFMPRP